MSSALNERPKAVILSKMFHSPLSPRFGVEAQRSTLSKMSSLDAVGLLWPDGGIGVPQLVFREKCVEFRRENAGDIAGSIVRKEPRKCRYTSKKGRTLKKSKTCSQHQSMLSKRRMGSKDLERENGEETT